MLLHWRLWLKAPDNSLLLDTQDLADKIAQLNSAIDDVSAQLKAQDNGAQEEPATAAAAVPT